MGIAFLVPLVTSVLDTLGSTTLGKKLEMTAIMLDWWVGIMAAGGVERPEGREAGSEETDMAMGYVL